MLPLGLLPIDPPSKQTVPPHPATNPHKPPSQKPQRQQDPNHVAEDVGVGGDNDPLDVCEIGLRQIPTGAVRALTLSFWRGRGGGGWLCV